MYVKQITRKCFT